jgi:hypothetical protein
LQQSRASFAAIARYGANILTMGATGTWFDHAKKPDQDSQSAWPKAAQLGHAA